MGLKSLTSKAISGEFCKAIESGWNDDWSTKISFFDSQSTQFTEEYRWVGDIPSFREWIGSRKRNELADYVLKVANVKYEDTLSVFADEVKFDKTNQVLARLQGIAAASSNHWGELLTPLIQNGASNLCYDGSNFFDTTHTWGVGSGVYSNRINYSLAAAPLNVDRKGTITAPSPELLSRAILSAIKQLFKFRSDTGRPINQSAKKFMVMVGIDYMDALLGATGLQTMAFNEPNLLLTSGFQLIPVVNPLINWTDKFAIFRMDGIGGTAPFIMQQMGVPEYTMLDETSDLYHKEHRMEWGASVYRGVGYGFPQHAIQTTLVA